MRVARWCLLGLLLLVASIYIPLLWTFFDDRTAFHARLGVWYEYIAASALDFRGRCAVRSLPTLLFFGEQYLVVWETGYCEVNSTVEHKLVWASGGKQYNVRAQSHSISPGHEIHR
jgi:hypothetical protein